MAGLRGRAVMATASLNSIHNRHGTAFQKRVLQKLGRIPPGNTRTYAEIARQIGAPAAVRAIGTAIGRNPVSVLVLRERKAWLLANEAAIVSGVVSA